MDNNIDNEEVAESTPKKKRKINFVKLPLALRIIIIIIVIALLLGIGALIPTALRSRETVIEFGFKDVGELVTQEWYGRILEDSKQDRKIFNVVSVPFTESRLIFSVDVEVLAGLDFNEISYKTKKDSEGKDIIVITLPHSKVYKSYEVSKSFVSYLDSESWFTNIDSAEQQSLKDAMVEKGTNQAIESGLLDKADKNAENIIRNMIKSNKITKNYEVEFEYK